MNYNLENLEPLSDREAQEVNGGALFTFLAIAFVIGLLWAAVD